MILSGMRATSASNASLRGPSVDGCFCRGRRKILCQWEAEEPTMWGSRPNEHAATDRAIAPIDANAVCEAFCVERDRLGMARALTTNAGRAWLKLLDEKDRS